MKWIDYIELAMQNLGGSSHYDELYKEIRKIRDKDFTIEWKATIRKTVEDHCPQSMNYRIGKRKVFKRIGHGYYELIKEDEIEILPVTDENKEQKYGKGGESDKHLKLKEYISKYPERIGLSKSTSSSIEYPFPTGDRVDIMMVSNIGIRYVIEIELEGENNLLIGAKQLIKYRALDLADNNKNLTDNSTRAILVAYKISGNKLREFCEKYDIRCFEVSII